MNVFPADENRAAVWQMNIGRANWERSPNSSVCEVITLWIRIYKTSYK